MKTKKGFTLVELIAVIAILAIIISIAGIGIVKVKENVVKNDYDNLITTIKIAAESYRQETGIDIVPVNILLQSGKLQADSTNYEDADEGISKGDPVIFNPIDGSPLNCAAFVFNGEEGEFDTEIGCSSEAIAANALNVEVYVGSNKIDYNINNSSSDNWIKAIGTDGSVKTIKLKSSIDAITTDGSVNYVWTNPLKPDMSYTGKEYIITLPESGLFKETINLTVKYDGKTLSKDFLIQIDGKKPTISDIFVSGKDNWAASKTLSGIITDNESTLAGYKVISGSSATCTDDSWIDVAEGTKSTDFSKILTANSDYYKVCVKDKAGYITASSSYIKVDKIDNVAPEMSISVANGTAYTKSKDATITITDKGPDGVNVRGFKNGQKYTIKYGWSTAATVACSSLTSTVDISFNENDKTASKTVTISGQTGAGKFYACIKGDNIADGIGNNTAINIQNKEMYLDNSAPTATFSISSRDTYNSTSATYTIKNISDTGSGLGKMCIAKENNMASCTWINAENKSANITANGTNGSGTTTTFYLFIKDIAGNVATISKAYTLYTTCSSTYSRTSEGSCNASCGSGTYKYTTTTYDSYFGTVCDTDSGRSSCYAGSCPDPDPEPYYGGGGKSSSGGGSSCDTTCQMQKNSAAWHDCTSQSCRDDLHAKNEELAKKNSDCGSSCTFNNNGSWYDSSGKKLY